MIKQLVAFALAAGFSMSASASFIQYNLSNVALGQYGQLEGWFVQDTSDNSIAYYRFWNASEDGPGSDFDTFWGEVGDSAIVSAESRIAGGPTSFRFSNQGYAGTFYEYHDVQLTFTQDAGTGNIVVSGWMDLVDALADPPSTFLSRDIHGGTLVQGNVDAALLASLEAGQTYVNRVVPATPAVPVPEPGSVALLLAGVWAMARLRRERPDARRGGSPVPRLLT